MAVTVNFELPYPDREADPPETVDEAFDTVAAATQLMDALFKAHADAIAGKAASVHTHEIASVTGLSAALAGKMAADATFSLEDMTDTDGIAAAVTGHVLVYNGTAWVPMSAAAAIGAHGHPISDVTGLSAALGAIDAELDGVALSIGSINGSLVSINGSIGSINGSIGSINGSIGSINGSLAAIAAGALAGNITQGPPGGDCDAFVGTGFFRSTASDLHRPADAGTTNMLVFQAQTATNRNWQIGARVSGNSTATDFWVRNQGGNGQSNWIRIGAGLTYLGTVQYTSSGTFSKASYPAATHILVEQQAPGGGGGGCSGSGSGVAVSGGGGGGEFAAGWFAVADLDASETVTIGAAGTGGSGNTAGNDGGDSSFRGMVSRGGRGGSGMAGGQTGNTLAAGGFDTSGGSWGSTVSAFGRVRVPGAPGGHGRVSNGAMTSFAEHGGGSYRGVGGQASMTSEVANGGRGYGGGGSGVRNVTSGGVSGGNGAPGITVIHLYHGEPR